MKLSRFKMTMASSRPMEDPATTMDFAPDDVFSHSTATFSRKTARTSHSNQSQAAVPGSARRTRNSPSSSSLQSHQSSRHQSCDSLDANTPRRSRRQLEAAQMVSENRLKRLFTIVLAGNSGCSAAATECSLHYWLSLGRDGQVAQEAVHPVRGQHL